jgi:hypothetical protein
LQAAAHDGSKHSCLRCDPKPQPLASNAGHR